MELNISDRDFTALDDVQGAEKYADKAEHKERCGPEYGVDGEAGAACTVPRGR